MKILDSVQNGVWVVSFEGGLDASTAPQVDEFLRKGVEEGRAHTVIDMSGVGYLASAGLRALQVGANLARKADGKFALAALEPSVAKVLELTGFSTALPVFDSVEAAVADLSGQPLPKPEAEPVEIYEVEGEIDAASAPALQRELMEKVSSGKHKVVVDFSKVVYVASAGFRAIQSAWMAARSRGGDVRFAGLQPKVEEVFSSLGFMQMYGVYPDLPTAVMSFGDDKPIAAEEGSA